MSRPCLRSLHSRATLMAGAFLLLGTTTGCDREGESGKSLSPDGKNPDGSAGQGGSQEQEVGQNPVGGGSSSAKDIALRLGRKAEFLFGVGGPQVPDLGDVTPDLLYVYLSGFGGSNGWRDWNPDGLYVNIVSDRCADNGIVPMFSLYEIAQKSHTGLSELTDAARMAQYWEDVEVMYERIAATDRPTVVHFEPDFWAFAHRHTEGDATAQSAILPAACAELPADLRGVGRCLVKLGRELAPQAVLGFHASTWADPDPVLAAAFLEEVGGREADLYVVDMLDRDAGCYEADAPECNYREGVYWDESNQTSPNFHEHLDWVTTFNEQTGKPILWWQLPLGVASDTPGGTPEHYRDNRVRYIFAHPEEFVEAGGLGAAFGRGALNQTTLDTDGGQYQRALSGYREAPTSLP